MEEPIKKRLVDELLKHIPEMPMEMGVSFDQANAVVLLKRYETLTQSQKNAIMGFLANLYVSGAYKKDEFLDPYLFGEFTDFPYEQTKELRDYAIGYLEIGGLIERKDNHIHIISAEALRIFAGMLIALIIGEKYFEKQSIDSEKFPRRLRLQEHGMGYKLFEVNNGIETLLCKIQSKGARRAFFDVCWKHAGTCIPFDLFHDELPLNEHQKFKPSEYLQKFRLQEGDRLYRYAYAHPEEGYVYFQKHYAPDLLINLVPNWYRNQQT